MSEQHAPSREQFKALLARIPSKYGEVTTHIAVLDDFDRMIDQTISAAEQRGAVKALRDAAESDDLIDHMYKHFDNHSIQIPPAAVRATATYLHNRANQMEGDE